MKNSVLFLLAIALLCALCVGCSFEADSSDDNTDPSAESQGGGSAWSEFPYRLENEDDLLFLAETAQTKEKLSDMDLSRFVEVLNESDGVHVQNAEILRNGAYFQQTFGEMKYYYRPVALPDFVDLNEMRVKDGYVTFDYIVDPKFSPDAFAEVGSYIMKWDRNVYPNWNSAAIKSTHEYDRSVESAEIDYYVARGITYGSVEKGDAVYIQGVYWDQDDYTFYAGVPDWFTDEDIKTYCRMEKVYIK